LDPEANAMAQLDVPDHLHQRAAALKERLAAGPLGRSISLTPELVERMALIEGLDRLEAEAAKEEARLAVPGGGPGLSPASRHPSALDFEAWTQPTPARSTSSPPTPTPQEAPRAAWPAAAGSYSLRRRAATPARSNEVSRAAFLRSLPGRWADCRAR
jgi:hypothetical protein